MDRYLKKSLQKDLGRKILLLSGPRQCGKTTLAKMLSSSFDYLNYDEVTHRLLLKEKSWDRKKNLLILDELHKMPKWKSWLKGIYDTEGLVPAIIVTGSAKIDTFKKVGDSLAGRYFQFRLHPFDLKELNQFLKRSTPEKNMERLFQFGGFPEPFLESDLIFYQRWQKTHLDIILKQDLIELETVHHITQIETLIEILKSQVGSPVSYSSLARDLQCSDKTIKRWLMLLENMYVIFKVTPFHKNIARSLLKQPKYYFYDVGQVQGNSGVKLENIVACALLKEIDFQNDVFGERFKLHYLKNKLKQEIDFLVTKNNIPQLLIEVKTSDDKLSPNFDHFAKYLPAHIQKIQLVKDLKREKTYPNGAEIRKASRWLSEFSF